MKLRKKCPACGKMVRVTRPRTRVDALMGVWEYECLACGAKFAELEEWVRSNMRELGGLK